jgi:hypothetical protein
MGRKPLGMETKTIGINMTKEMSDQLEVRANSMHISTSKYCKIIFRQWLDSGGTLKLSEK